VKYRVVKDSDGYYKCQWRIFLFWWFNSEKEATLDMEEQVRFARRCMTKWPKQAPVKVVWP
jgi:hypothetical protein